MAMATKEKKYFVQFIYTLCYNETRGIFTSGICAPVVAQPHIFNTPQNIKAMWESDATSFFPPCGTSVLAEVAFKIIEGRKPKITRQTRWRRLPTTEPC